MLFRKKSLVVLISAIAIAFPACAQSDLTLWYNQPAANWNEALPVGNGRLGAMVFGNAKEEFIQLNEETLWSGGPVNTNPNPQAHSYLAKIREALFKEDYEEAGKLTSKMQGLFTESYEPLGDLFIKHHLEGVATNYYRDLDISNAISTTRFSVDGIEYVREIFVSKPDDVIVIRLTSSQKNALNFTVAATSQLYHENSKVSDDVIMMRGRAPSHTDPSYLQTMEIPVVYGDPTNCRGMRFELQEVGS